MRGVTQKADGPRRQGVITSLVVKGSRPDRVTVYLEGSRAFDVAAAVADGAGLRIGGVLSPEAQDRLLAEDAPYRARDRALGLLALRDRSRHEVRSRLEAAGFDPAIAAEVVAWLEGLDYLDDRRFATRYAAEKAKGGWGERRIRAELLRKGVERRVVDEALEEVGLVGGDAAGGMEAVVNLARRRFGRQFEVDPRGAARRLAGFLARRGYDWDTIHAVGRTLSEEAERHEQIPLP